MSSPPLFKQAKAMAKEGLGVEDLLVALGDQGLTKSQARVAVFGENIARRMNAKDRRRAEVRKAS